MSGRRTLLWDPLVRVFHACVAGAFIANYVFTEAGEAWHERIGYGAVVWVLVRTAWGFVGAGAARWSHFWPTLPHLSEHVRQLLRGAGHEGLGHSPIGALVMIALMAGILALGATGYMLQETDTFFGSEFVQEAHKWIANGMLALVAIHIVAAVVESLRLRENLPLSMISGYRTWHVSDQNSQAEAHRSLRTLLALGISIATFFGWLWFALR